MLTKWSISVKRENTVICVGGTTTLYQVWPVIANGIVDIKNFCILTTTAAPASFRVFPAFHFVRLWPKTKKKGKPTNFICGLAFNY